MLVTRTNPLTRKLSLLLAPALSMAVGACDATDVDPPEAPSKQITGDSPVPEASDLVDPVVMNEAIQAGTRAFAHEHGVEALWELVDPTLVGNIQSVSDDGTKVLFLGAMVGADGFMVPSGALWLADLARGELTSLGAELDVPLHAGVLSPDGARVAAVGGERGHLYMSDSQRPALSMAVENDGAASIAGLTWNQAGDKLGFVISPYVHLEDFEVRADANERLPEALPSASIAWIDAGEGAGGEARTIDRVPVVADGLVHVSGLRWNGDALELAGLESAVADGDTGEVVSKGYCAPGNMKRAGNYLALKLPWESGQSYMVGDDCTHANRGDQLDFDIDGGSLHDGGAVLSVAAGRVVALRTDIADPSEWTCINSYVSYDANYVAVQHFGSSNTAFTSLYWHLRRNPSVQVSYNQQVNQGTILGYNGCTGYAYGEHLHFGMRDGASFSYSGTEAVPEPIDGYSNLDAGNWYTSTNSSSGGGTPPPSSGNLLVREGSGYALNGYSPYNGRELTVWSTSSSDPDQRWDLLAPGSFGGNAGWMIRRRGTSYCVNAPSLYDYAPVSLWSCSGSDADQQFDRIDYGSSRLYRRRGSNYCLNGHEMSNYGQVTLWTCNTGDIEQRWVVQ
ncbi:ricin-type beta-trefoil lectin domain protein [Haliangium sp.]|uniref:ricin-type beta-trefoil lectin domain protein n=1 Tax=Haliangium sp. TaxID=2663208 RepID=UPI003D0AF238